MINIIYLISNHIFEAFFHGEHIKMIFSGSNKKILILSVQFRIYVVSNMFLIQY